MFKQITTIVLLALFITTGGKMIAQQDSTYTIPSRGEINPILKHRHKEIGLNMTYLLSQFVPLSGRKIYPGVIDYSYKYFYDNESAFRFGFGSGIEFGSGSNFGTSLSFHFGIRLGFEKRKHLYKKWYYTRGLDALVYGGNITGAPVFGSNDFDFFPGGAGIGPVIGLEYHLNDFLYLSTESMLFFGFPLILVITPPSALILHYIIP